jgi:hypothetical protein
MSASLAIASAQWLSESRWPRTDFLKLKLSEAQVFSKSLANATSSPSRHRPHRQWAAFMCYAPTVSRWLGMAGRYDLHLGGGAEVPSSRRYLQESTDMSARPRPPTAPRGGTSVYVKVNKHLGSDQIDHRQSIRRRFACRVHCGRRAAWRSVPNHLWCNRFQMHSVIWKRSD